MTILGGWDSSQLRNAGRIDIDVKKITPEEQVKIQEQHDRAMVDEPMWSFFGGVVNLGHRHFQVVP